MAEYELSENGTLLPWIPAQRISSGDKAHAQKQSDNIFSTKVETWKYHDESVRCSACGVKDVPIILTKRQKYTKSRVAAFCLLGCWPFCFIPLLMNRDKNVRTLCPRCGHDYGVRSPTDKLLLACSPKCTFDRTEKLNDFPISSQPRHSQVARCSGLSRTQMDYQDRQMAFSTGDEAARALRVSEERPRRGGEESGYRHRNRSQSKLSRGYAFCANQVTNHLLSCDECSSDVSENEGRDRRRDLAKSRTPKVSKARGCGEPDCARMAAFDFYARQVFCRECG